MTVSDAEKYQSSQMNRGIADAAESCTGGVKVLFLGNSITIHPVMPEIGWDHEWGMAADAAEHDYVHLVSRGIEQVTGRYADVRIRNLASFERGFRDYDFWENQDLIGFQAEYLVVALRENVAALETAEERLEFRNAFRKLLECFASGKRKPHTVIRGVFWPNKWKDEILSAVAAELDLTFVKADIAGDKDMLALGKFDHEGIQKHPGNWGKAEIAHRILSGFFPGERLSGILPDTGKVFLQ